MHHLLLCALLCVVTSCSPKSEVDKHQGVLTDPQQKTLEKSKKVENTLEAADKERREKSGEE